MVPAMRREVSSRVFGRIAAGVSLMFTVIDERCCASDGLNEGPGFRLWAFQRNLKTRGRPWD
jgi:hypothetical protein